MGTDNFSSLSNCFCGTMMVCQVCVYSAFKQRMKHKHFLLENILLSLNVQKICKFATLRH